MLWLAACLVVSDSVTPWPAALQAPLSVGFSRQEHWSGLPFPPPGDLPDPGVEPASLTSAALAIGLFTASATWEAQFLEIGRIQKGEEGVMCDPVKGQGVASRAAGGLEGTQPQVGEGCLRRGGSLQDKARK